MLVSSATLAGLGMLALPLATASGEDVEIGEFDFFDYLGSMVEQDGEWLDPLEFDDVADDAGDVPVDKDVVSDEPDRSADDPVQPEGSR